MLRFHSQFDSHGDIYRRSHTACTSSCSSLLSLKLSNIASIALACHQSEGIQTYCREFNRDSLQVQKIQDSRICWSYGLAVMTSGLHPVGPRFDPGYDLIFCSWKLFDSIFLRILCTVDPSFHLLADLLDPSTSMAIDLSINFSPPQSERRKRTRSKSQLCHRKRHCE